MSTESPQIGDAFTELTEREYGHDIQTPQKMNLSSSIIDDPELSSVQPEENLNSQFSPCFGSEDSRRSLAKGVRPRLLSNHEPKFTLDQSQPSSHEFNHTMPLSTLRSTGTSTLNNFGDKERFYSALQLVSSSIPGTSLTPGSSSNLKGSSLMLNKTELLATAPWTVVEQTDGNIGLRNAISRAQIGNIIDDVLWVGTIGKIDDSVTEKTLNAISAKLDRDHQCCPVFAKSSIIEGCYDQYCKQVLWPTFHYELPDASKPKKYQHHSWDHYKMVNEQIAKAIVERYKEGDTIWVNDYHLLLVPKLIREKRPRAKIGFFLHISFPASEVFRCIPSRNELLEGILGADCVGFQTPDHARQFLQTCNRILAVDTTPTSVRIKQNSVSVVVQPIGIDPEHLWDNCTNEQVNKYREGFRERWKNHKVIVARDKLDNIRGIKRKLLAYEKFLKTHPEMIGKVVLVQVCMSNKTDTELVQDLTAVSDRINSLKSSVSSEEPCFFLHKNIDFTEYVALLAEADAFAVTSVREGMNLTSHEFIYCNDSYSPLILSEFTGAATVLGLNAILVNPFDLTEMATAFHLSLTMDEKEKRQRWNALHDIVMRHTCSSWVKGFLEDVDMAWMDQQRRKCEVVPTLDELMLREDYQTTKYSYRLFFLELESPVLSIEKDLLSSRSPLRRRDIPSDTLGWVGLNFEQSRNRSEGRPLSSHGLQTKSPSHRHKKNTLSLGSTIDSEVLYYPEQNHENHPTYLISQGKLSVLADLVSDPGNIVYVTSRDDKESLEQMFKHIPNIGLIAEEGAFYRTYGSDFWESLNESEKGKEWHHLMLPWINRVIEQLPGIQLKIDGSTMILDVRTCIDQVRVKMIIGDLLNHVNDGFEKLDVHAVLHDGQVHISSKVDLKLLTMRKVFQIERGHKRLQSLFPSGDIGMLFIAAVDGKTENDQVFEWANAFLTGVYESSVTAADAPTSSHTGGHNLSLADSAYSSLHSARSSMTSIRDQYYENTATGAHGNMGLDDITLFSGGSEDLNWAVENDRVDMFSTLKTKFKVPVVYTVSVGGTATSAQVMVDGVNGLLNALGTAVRPLV